MCNESTPKPWGTYRVIDQSDSHQAKQITVQPYQRLSYQRHQRRSEHWFIVAGEAEATVGGRTLRLRPGSSVDVPLGVAHRITNACESELVLIEVQTGEYFDEDDIERLDDDYGRIALPVSRHGR